MSNGAKQDFAMREMKSKAYKACLTVWSCVISANEWLVTAVWLVQWWMGNAVLGCSCNVVQEMWWVGVSSWKPPPQRAASRRSTHRTIQEGGGAEVESGEETEGQVHVEEPRPGTVAKPSECQGGADGTGSHLGKADWTGAHRVGTDGIGAHQGTAGGTGAHQGGADETGAHQGGADETGAHQGGADETRAHQGGAETHGRDWDLEETETQEAERAHLVSRTEPGSLDGHGRSGASGSHDGSGDSMGHGGSGVSVSNGG